MVLPIFPMSAVLLPDGAMEIRVDNKAEQAMLETCLSEEKDLGIVFCENEQQNLETMRSIGCVASIVEHTLYEDGTCRLLVEGLYRFKVGLVKEKKQTYQAEENLLEDTQDLAASDPLLATADTQVKIYRELLGSVDPAMLRAAPPSPLRPGDSFKVIDQILLPEEKRQTALELASQRSRFELAIKFLRIEIERLRFLLAEPEEMITDKNQMN